MAAPVWVLSVDLQAKTATFQSGMADAAKSARGSFQDIQSGAGQMGGAVSGSMMRSRQTVMLLGEEFGVHLPRGVTTFIASLGPVGPALQAAFPFAAVAVGALLLINHLQTLAAEGHKLTEDQVQFGTAVQKAFNVLDEKLLSAKIHADELRNDHLGALRNELALIDKQSMDDLVTQFGLVQAAADKVFAGLKVSWYQFGSGAAGAKSALEDFQTKYDSLLVQGKNVEASDLLKGTRQSAEKVLALQKEAAEAGKHVDHTAHTRSTASLTEARDFFELKKAGVGITEKEVQAQQTLIEALKAQESIEAKVAALKKQDQSNAKTSTGKEMSSEAAAGNREAAEHAQKMGEISLQGDKAVAESALAIKEASVAERLASDIGFADREMAVQLAGNAALISALDRGGKEYNNQLKGLREKAEEIEAQHGQTVRELTAKSQEAQYREDIQNLETAERGKIEETEQGSAARLTAIDAAIAEERSKGLEQMSFFRDLLNQRVQEERRAADEAAKLAQEAGKEEADNAEKMGMLTVAAMRERDALIDSEGHVSEQKRVQQAIAAADAEYAVKQAAMAKEAATLDKTAKDYDNKLKQIQNKELQLTRQHENELTEIKSKAEQERNSRILAAEGQFQDAIASGLTQTLMGHKSFASMMNSLGNQVVSGLMENALKAIIANDMTKPSDAAKAARMAFNNGEMIPLVGTVLGPVFAAAAFASVMAFQGGGVVPGIGNTDSVPAMLTPGEGVVPKGVMEGLSVQARNGNMGGGNHFHAHVTQTNHVQVLDGDGMSKVLEKNSDKLQKHVENTMRRMNK